MYQPDHQLAQILKDNHFPVINKLVQRTIVRVLLRVAMINMVKELRAIDQLPMHGMSAGEVYAYKVYLQDCARSKPLTRDSRIASERKNVDKHLLVADRVRAATASPTASSDAGADNDGGGRDAPDRVAAIEEQLGAVHAKLDRQQRLLEQVLARLGGAGGDMHGGAGAGAGAGAGQGQAAWV